MNIPRIIWTIGVLYILGAQPALGAAFEWQPEIQLRGSKEDPNSSFSGGSFIQRTDGKMLVTYQFKNKVMLSYVDSEDEFLTVDNASAKNEWIFHTLYSPGWPGNDSRLQRLKSGRLLLYVAEAGVEDDPERPFRVEVYESKNGLGTDFRLKSRMVEQLLPLYTFGARTIGNAIEVKGRIYMPLAWPTGALGSERLDSNLFPD